LVASWQRIRRLKVFVLGLRLWPLQGLGALRGRGFVSVLAQHHDHWVIVKEEFMGIEKFLL
jgi:hypothetical protein